MNCPSKSRNGRLRLIEFASGRAGAIERMDLHAHADSCTACRSLIAEQRQVCASLDCWGAVAPSLDFDRKLYARIEREANDNWLRRCWRMMDPPLWIGRPSVPLAIAAVIVAGFFAGDAPHWIAALRGHLPGSLIPDLPRVQAQDAAEQLNQALDDLQLLDQLDSVKRPAHRTRSRPL